MISLLLFIYQYHIINHFKSSRTKLYCIDQRSLSKYMELLPLSITTKWSGSLNDDIQNLSIYEDNEIIAFYKPPSYLVQSENVNNLKSDTINSNKNNEIIEENMIDAYQKIVPSAGIVNRIDRPCSGIILFSKTKQANTYLNKVFQNRIIDKQYICIVNGKIDVGTKVICHDYLTKSSILSRVKVISTISNNNLSLDNSNNNSNNNNNNIKVPKNSVEAKLCYESIYVTNRGTEARPIYQSILKIKLDTGRKHQIRVQLAHRGYSICGDTKYNAIQKFQWRDIALHSYCLVLPSYSSRTKEGNLKEKLLEGNMKEKYSLSLTIEPPRIWEKRFGNDVMNAISNEIQNINKDFNKI